MEVFCNLTFEQIVKLVSTWTSGLLVAWWWVTKVINPLIGLWVRHGLWFVLTGSHRFDMQLRG